MDPFVVSNIKSLIIFVHLSGLAFGVGGAWMLDLYILRKMYKSPVTQENIQIISFVSKIVLIGLVMLWFSGLLFIVFYYFVQPESLLNHKIWAKLAIVIVLTLNGYCLHKFVLPIVVKNKNKIIINAASLKQINLLTLIGCISFITWPLVMLLGTFKSINFVFSFSEILTGYALILLVAITVAFLLKSYLVEQEMDRKIRELSEQMSCATDQLTNKQKEIDALIKVFKA